MSVAGLGASAQSAITGKIKAGVGQLAKNPATSIAVAHGVVDVNRKVNEGHSITGAVAKSAVETALYSMNPGLMTAIQLTPLAIQGVQAAQQYRRGKAEQMLSAGNASQRVGNGFMDTAQAQTMRQAALQQIQGNKLNARSALGGEARIFSNRRYTG